MKLLSLIVLISLCLHAQTQDSFYVWIEDSQADPSVISIGLTIDIDPDTVVTDPGSLYDFT